MPQATVTRSGRPQGERITKICRGCKKPFDCTPSRAACVQSCSIPCRDKWRREAGVQKRRSACVETCLACNQPYSCLPSQVGKRKFCSWKCRVPYMKAHRMMQPNGRTILTCANCNQPFEVVSFNAKPGPRQRKFCSEGCRYSFVLRHGSPKRKPKKLFICRWCKKPFEKLECQSRDCRAAFCSRQCNGAYTARQQKRVSAVESRFFDELEAAGFLVDRQQRLGRFCVDAIAKGTNIAIEFDGEYWHSLPRVIEKDARKEIEIAHAGYKLIRVPERQYLTNPTQTVQFVIDTARAL